MNLKNFIKVFFLSAGIVCAVSCSDDNGTSVGQIPAPDNITYRATQSTLHFEWGTVSVATSYEVSLAKESTPADQTVIETTNTFCDFTGLEGGTTYVFALRALCSSDSSKSYSDYVEGTATTRDYSKLSAPTGLTVSKIYKTEATISWDSVSEAANYKLVVENFSTGARACNEVLSETSYIVTGLTGLTRYTVTLKALVSDGTVGSEYDSEEVTTTFETSNAEPLTAPTVKVAAKSHALAILEWELSDAALAEQSAETTDTYNFRLCDADGNVMREVDNDDSFSFTKYPSFRIAWGGLTASTTYKLEMQRVSTENTEAYLDSEWASVEVTTDPAPDTSGYLLYWDFDNVPFNACAMYAAYGFMRPTKELDWTDPENVILSPAGTSTTTYTQTVSSGLGQSFFDAYFPGMNKDDVLSSSDTATYVEGSTHNITVEVGHMKFGASSRPAWMSLPAISSLSANSTIYLEIDTCPYTEPSSDGDYLSPSNSDRLEYFYVWAPGAKIESVEGETAERATIDSNDEGLVRLRNVLVTGSTFKNGSENPYRYTSHKVKISGVGPDTRIVVYTALENDGSNHRLWVDNVKISMAE